MTNINNQVWNYIGRRVEIKRTLPYGLINVSALARKISEELGLEKNVDAVISAIRRYDGTARKEIYKVIFEKLSKAKLKTKTKLCSLIVDRNEETLKKMAEIPKKIEILSSTLRRIELTNFTTMIGDADVIKKVRTLFLQRDIVKKYEDLAELEIYINEDLSGVPGIFAMITNELAMNEISIHYSMSSHRELILIVDEANLEKAFSVIFDLTKK